MDILQDLNYLKECIDIKSAKKASDILETVEIYVYQERTKAQIGKLLWW